MQQLVDKEGQSYFASLEINNVTVEDAGKYKVTAKNELGESNATISLNFDSKYNFFYYVSFKNILETLILYVKSLHVFIVSKAIVFGSQNFF